jgi:F-type H+-transporting ATPase subunit b
LAIKPAAKKGLLIFGILYAITVAVMVTAFVRAAKPKNPQAAARAIQAKLNEVLLDLQKDPAEGTEPASEPPNMLEADPEHVRTREVSEKEAVEIFQRYFPARGQIIGINITLVMQCLNFGILMLLLYGFLWDPLLEFLDQRRRAIRQRIDDAAASKQQADQALRERREELAEIRRTRAGIIEQAHSMGEQEGDQIVERARREAQRHMEQTQERLDEQVRAARSALRSEVADLAARIAAQILKREVSQRDHEVVIAEMLDRMEPGTPDAGAGP